VTSIYHVNFYSVAGWQHGDIGATVSAPLKAEVVDAPVVDAPVVDAPVEPYVPQVSSAESHDALMALYQSAQQELERERVRMAELAESLARYVRDRNFQQE
jgi:hypothetical protein